MSKPCYRLAIALLLLSAPTLAQSPSGGGGKIPSAHRRAIAHLYRLEQTDSQQGV